MKKLTKSLVIAASLLGIALVTATRLNINPKHQVGDKLDELNGVAVYFNGAINHTEGRNLTADGYNLGLKYQCVEFVKRYYFERFQHKMPNAMGHAKDFFLESTADGELNPDRNLIQYRNDTAHAPAAEDLIVFKPWALNPYGHVAIISQVGDDFIEVIQQNAGPFGSTRERYPLRMLNGRARVEHERVLGWLRRPPASPEMANKND